MTDPAPAAPRTREELDALVDALDGLVVLFTEDFCQVAEAVEPKLAALLAEQFPALRMVVVSRNDAPELLAQLGVLSFPTVVLYFGGRETQRFVRTFAIDAVGAAIDRPYEILFGAS